MSLCGESSSGSKPSQRSSSGGAARLRTPPGRVLRRIGCSPFSQVAADSLLPCIRPFPAPLQGGPQRELESLASSLLRRGSALLTPSSSCPAVPLAGCRVGFSENLVRKGLMFLQTTGDFEYRRERRLVHRMK